MTYTKTRVLLEPGTLYQGFMPISILKPDEIATLALNKSLSQIKYHLWY